MVIPRSSKCAALPASSKPHRPASAKDDVEPVRLITRLHLPRSRPAPVRGSFRIVAELPAGQFQHVSFGSTFKEAWHYAWATVRSGDLAPSATRLHEQRWSGTRWSGHWRFTGWCRPVPTDRR